MTIKMRAAFLGALLGLVLGLCRADTYKYPDGESELRAVCERLAHH